MTDNTEEKGAGNLGKFGTAAVVKQHLDYLYSVFELREEYISELRKEIEHLKSETYKDEELSRLKKELKETREELRNGFGITSEEDEAIRAWINEHERNHPGGHGVSGGKYQYIFVPTGIGVFGKVKCTCGAEFKFGGPR